MKTPDQSNLIQFPTVIDDLNKFRIYAALMELNGDDEYHATHQIMDGLIEYFESLDDPWAAPCVVKLIELKALTDEMFNNI